MITIVADFNTCGPTKLSKSEMNFRSPATANDSPNAFAKAKKSDGLDVCPLSCMLATCVCKCIDGNVLILS